MNIGRMIKIVLYGVTLYALGRFDVLSQEFVFILVALTIFTDVMTSSTQTKHNNRDGVIDSANLPFWMTRPDIETTEWINSVLSKMWPLLSTAMNRKVREVFKSEMLILNFIDLGNLSPAVDGIQTFKQTGDSIVLDVGVRFVGDRSCQLGISLRVGNLFTIPVIASRFRFRATIRMRCEGIGGELPCIDRVTVSIPKQLNEIDFSLYVLTKHVDLANIPLLRTLWKSFLHHSLRDVLLWPRQIVVPMRGDAMELSSNLNLSKEPLILTVDVISANDVPLHPSDSSNSTENTETMTENTGNFYVLVLRISDMENRTNPSTSSSTVGNVCKETLWNESFSFRVRGTKRSRSNKSRVLLVSMYNSHDLRSQGDSATPVGLAKISLEKMPLGRTTNAKIPLFRISSSKKQRTKSGWLIFRLRLSLVHDENKIEDIQNNSTMIATTTPTKTRTNKKGLKIVKVKHGTQRLAVIVHRCSNLSNGSFLSSKCNPYVSVRLGDDKTTTQRSTTKFGTNAPTFEEKFEFLLRTKDKTEAWAHAACGSLASIQIQVKSHNDLIPDEFLGMKRIKFTENDTGGCRRKYKLKGSSSSGTIEVSVFWCR